MRARKPLSGGETSPRGLERTLLRQPPLVALVGTVVPMLWALGMHHVHQDGSASEIARTLIEADIYAIALVGLVWMGVLTRAIGCITVVIMKGPRYLADSYPIPDREQPAPAYEPAARSDTSSDVISPPLRADRRDG